MSFDSHMKYLGLNLDEVHIWSACLSEHENDVAYFSSLLSKDERERANSFRFPKDQKRYIIARGILRNLLAGYLGEAPQFIEIIYGLWGKPCLPQEKLLHFNTSHSRDYALYAVTLDYEVGIDLEYIDRNLELEDIALSLFSPQELNYWKSLNHEEKVDSFFNLWVCKESLLKALGKGWLENQKLALKESCTSKQRAKNKFLSDRVTYPYCFRCIPGYASALFIEGPSLHPLQYTWDLSDFKN